MKLYIAYGSNLNKEQMKYRCPRAIPVCTGMLNNWQLIYRGSKTGSYASIRYKKGHKVPVAIWNITESDEKNLDIYEGYPHFYIKKNIVVIRKDGTKIKAMAYIMRTDATVGRPSKFYIRTILLGYKDFGLDMKYLEESIIFNYQEIRERH